MSLHTSYQSTSAPQDGPAWTGLLSHGAQAPGTIQAETDAQARAAMVHLQVQSQGDSTHAPDPGPDKQPARPCPEARTPAAALARALHWGALFLPLVTRRPAPRSKLTARRYPSHWASVPPSRTLADQRHTWLQDSGEAKPCNVASTCVAPKFSNPPTAIGHEHSQ